LSLAALDVSKQGQNEEDDEDRPESADGIVAPAGAVRPRGQGADDQNDQNDEYDKTHFGLCVGQPITRAPQQRQNRRTVPNATTLAKATNLEMRQFTDILSISTRGRGLVEITRDVLNWLKPYGVQAGLLTLFCRHTSAGLLIQENAAPDVRADLETFFDRLAPEDAARYRHADEGADDMPAHIRTALSGVQLAIPILHGRLALGTWQGIYLFEHRRSPHRREIALHLIGE
jgi:secondary thiamine-phosphate synthase enzyme